MNPSKKHALLDDLAAGLDDAQATPADGDAAEAPAADARVRTRENRILDRLSGEVEEKVLRRIDPAEARMWENHNRAYDLLTEENCRDLIDGIRAQGRQEFPAIVRRTGEAETPYEVICGARRHFAVSWLQANNYPQIRYLVEVRDLTDEEAFRLADIENRDRQDISDYERACDYLRALEQYYGGVQLRMANRLEVSDTWLSRYLQLARLPIEVIRAFSSLHDLREIHARKLKPHLAREDERAAIFDEALAIKQEPPGIRERDPNRVVARLLGAVRKPKRKAADTAKRYGGEEGGAAIVVRERGGETTVSFGRDMERTALERAFEAFLAERFGAAEG